MPAKRFTWESWGIKPVINALTYMTPIGGSTMPPEAAQAMADSAPYFVDMHAVYKKAGEVIAKHTGAEAGMVTAGAMSGMLLQAAACMTGTDPTKVGRLPDTTGMRNEILYFPIQRVTYFRAFQMAGAKLVPMGEDARVADPGEMEEAFTDRTAAVAYVFGPRVGYPLPLRTVVDIAHSKGVPVIVDAAAMVPPVENLKSYIAGGADLVAFSGGKGIRGPQSTGILAGRRELIEAAYMNSSPNYRCVGRAMKVSKEEIAALITALEIFVGQDHKALWERWRARAESIARELQGMPGLSAVVDESPALREGPQVILTISRHWTGPLLRDVKRLLFEGDPPILVGYHHYGYPSDRAELIIGVETLKEEEDAVVVKRLKEVLSIKR